MIRILCIICFYFATWVYWFYTTELMAPGTPLLSEATHYINQSLLILNNNIISHPCLPHICIYVEIYPKLSFIMRYQSDINSHSRYNLKRIVRAKIHIWRRNVMYPLQISLASADGSSVCSDV